MKKSETIQVIALLAGNYNSIADKSDKQKELMVTTWQECLGDLNYQLVLQAVKKTMLTSKFPPTIAEVRENALELINPEKERTAIEAWEEAYSMICGGTYMTKEQFELASPEVKKFFGSVRQVAELARTDIDVVNTVTKGQFLKQYEVIKAQEKEQRLLPENMKNKLAELQRNVIKQIGA